MIMEITFEILMEACEYNGDAWKDRNNCNHSSFTFCEDELDETGEGYDIRSNAKCAEEFCPFLQGMNPADV